MFNSELHFVSILRKLVAKEKFRFILLVSFMILEIGFSALFVGSMVPLGEVVIGQSTELSNVVGSLISTFTEGETLDFKSVLILTVSAALLKKIASIGGYLSAIGFTEMLRLNFQSEILRSTFSRESEIHKRFSVGEALDWIVRIADRAAIAVLKGIGFAKSLVMILALVGLCLLEDPLISLALLLGGLLVVGIFWKFYFPISRRKGQEIIWAGSDLSSELATTAKGRDYLYCNNFDNAAVTRGIHALNKNTSIRVQTKVLSQVPVAVVVVLGIALIMWVVADAFEFARTGEVIVLAGFFGVVGSRLVESFIHLMSERHSFLNRLQSLEFLFSELGLQYKNGHNLGFFEMLSGERIQSSEASLNNTFDRKCKHSSNSPFVVIRLSDLQANLPSIASESDLANHQQRLINYGSGTLKISGVCGMQSVSGGGKSLFLRQLFGLQSDLFAGRSIISVETRFSSNEIFDLRGRTAYLDDNVCIYRGSVWDNINLDKDNIQISQKLLKEVWEVLNLEELGSWSDSKTIMLEADGRNISLGQRQRIGIARLMLSKREFFVLDEATTGLQWEMEKRIIDWLRSSFAGGIVVSHSARLLEYCDSIWILDGDGLRVL